MKRFRDAAGNIVEAEQAKFQSEPENIRFGALQDAPPVSLIADEGDWIVKGADGSTTTCKPDIFAATYEAVE